MEGKKLVFTDKIPFNKGQHMLVHNCFVTIAGQVDRWMLRGRDAGRQTGVKASRQATRRKTRNYLY